MNRLRHLLAFMMLVATLALTGCGRAAGDTAEVLAAPSAVVARPADLPYAAHAKRERQRKHYFLVAGASDAANYAWEIVQQEQYLRKHGVAADDIACFYARPSVSAFLKEASRWNKLAPSLAHCFPANAKMLYEQITDGEVSRTPIYFYASAHGGMPISKEMALTSDAATLRTLRETQKSVPELDQYFVQMASSNLGVTLEFEDALSMVILRVSSMRDLFLTPAYLRDALDQAAARGVPRHVVVQACHSGGFIDGTRIAALGSTGLRGEDYSILTASHPDRPSFGCGVGSERTYFGGAYNDALFATGQLPKDVNFTQLHATVSRRIENLEKQYREELAPEKRAKFKPSLPQVSVGGASLP